MAIREMVAAGCEEVVLEAVVTNYGALKLYQGLGFLRDKHLHRWGCRGLLGGCWGAAGAGREWHACEHPCQLDVAHAAMAQQQPRLHGRQGAALARQ
jgi:hypothetical protein